MRGFFIAGGMLVALSLVMASMLVGIAQVPPPTPPGITSGGSATFSSITITGAGDTSLTTGAFTRNFKIPAGALSKGTTAPVDQVTGTTFAVCFDQDAEQAFMVFEVPSDWDQVSDMAVLVEWHPEEGVAIADTETVIWSTQYHSITDGDPIDNGTPVTTTGTYTQSGAGLDLQQITTSIPIDFDDVNQPLARGDHVHFQFDRDMTGDTYASDACPFELMIQFNSLGLFTGGA